VPLNFRTLDLNLLRVFDRVMAEGSLTRAAAALAMTQPAVSHALKRLHEAVGEALFRRSAHGMKPTPRAEALWPQVRGALDSLQQALAPSQFDPRRDAANFHLAMADATAALLTPPLVAAVESQRALANLRTLPLTTRDPRRLIEQGEADLAIGHFPEAGPAIIAAGDHATLRRAHVYDMRYVCVMRRGHALSRSRTLTLDAYCKAHHLLVNFSGRPHGLVDQALAALGRERRVVLTVNQFFTASRVVTQSDLLSVLPSTFVAASGYEHELLTRELPFELPGTPVEMVWHVRNDLHPAHQWLRALVQQAGDAIKEPAGITPAGARRSQTHIAR
jgi:DNA-binding transcriptional LysR family regulator